MYSTYTRGTRGYFVVPVPFYYTTRWQQLLDMCEDQNSSVAQSNVFPTAIYFPFQIIFSSIFCAFFFRVASGSLLAHCKNKTNEFKKKKSTINYFSAISDAYIRPWGRVLHRCNTSIYMSAINLWCSSLEGWRTGWYYPARITPAQSMLVSVMDLLFVDC